MPERIIPITPGNIYHIYNRGVNKQKIFFSEKNYQFFIYRLNKFFQEYAICYAYCLMPNHYHLLVFSVIILRISKIKFIQIKVMLIYVLIFIFINAVFTFLFEPEYGVTLYSTRHPIVKLWGDVYLTQEQLLYQVTLAFKYLSVVPLGIIFLLTTNPSEFASSVSGVGVPYKASFAISLTLRYFPDILRVYNDISQAQQARGLEMSGKAKMKERVKNSLMIIIPLIFSTLERIEVVTNAMDLRGFGKLKRRTWYTKAKLKRSDYIALIFSVLISLATAAVSVFINHSRFYNPFV